MVLNIKLISIEGNIGSGKSTFIKLMQKYITDNGIKNYIFLQEPVDEWTNLKDKDGTNILQKFYTDQSRWSYTFQTIAFLTRCMKIENILKELEKKSNENEEVVIIMERSVYTDRNVFASLLKDEGKITELEWNIYDEWFLWLANSMKYLIPYKHIYLQANPEVSYERMKLRNRDEENTVSLDYIIKVSKKHDEWLNEHMDCVCINVNENFINNKDKLMDIISKVIY